MAARKRDRAMLGDSWTYRIVLALSGIAVILVIVYLIQVEQNRSLRAEVDQRQQFINQSIQFNRVDEALIRALANTAVSEKDDKLRELLAQNGITINPKTGTQTAAPGAGALPAANPSAAPAPAGATR
jgi:hypothetical protein